MKSDKKFMKRLEEAGKYIKSYKEGIERQLPEGWKLFTWAFPIQYEKNLKIGKKTYVGYLRSRWGYPFCVEIHEKGRNEKNEQTRTGICFAGRGRVQNRV